MLEATLLEGCSRDMEVYTEEAFGPVVILSKFSDWHAALEEVNDSKFGLQAGIFTRDIHKVLDAWDGLDVGGVVVNDVSSYRVDNMPYGGVKDFRAGPRRGAVRDGGHERDPQSCDPEGLTRRVRRGVAIFCNSALEWQDGSGVVSGEGRLAIVSSGVR